MAILDYLAIAAKVGYVGTLYTMFKSKKMLTGLIQGYIQYLSMIDYGIRWVGPPILPNKWRKLRIT